MNIKNLVFYWLPGAFTLCFLAGSFLQMQSFVINDTDFGYFLTQPWRIWQGWDWRVPFAEEVEPPYYAVHLTPLSLFLAPFIGLFPSPYALSVLHALAAGAIAFLLPRLVHCLYTRERSVPASRPLPDQAWIWTALALLLIFFAFRPFLAAWTRQTHFTFLVTPFLALGCLYLLKGRSGLAVACAIVVCLGQERAAAQVFGLGMYAWLLMGERRLGIGLCLLSCVWFFGATHVWLPMMRTLANAGDGYFFGQQFMPFAELEKKAAVLGMLCVYTAFLPFCGRRALLTAACALPTLGMMLVSSSRYHMLHFSGHYYDMASIFLLLSMAEGLRWLQSHLAIRRWKTLFAAGTAAYLLLMLTAQTGWYNPLITSLRLLHSPHRAEFLQLARELAPLRRVPDDVTLYAQSGLGPHVELNRERYRARAGILEAPLKKAVIAISPLATNEYLGAGQAEFSARADAHPDLALLWDTGRLRVYASRDLAESHPEFLERLKRGHISAERAPGTNS